MPGEDRFTVRPYRDGDETAILDLFSRSFPHAPRSLDEFAWKYRRNPLGNEHISLTFDADRRLVGHYAGYLVPFRKGTRNLVAHQVGDTMTDPSIRHIGRGRTSVLGKTALDFYGRFCEGHVAFNYGFNVANIQRFSLRFLRSDRVEPVLYRILDARRAPAPLRATLRLTSGVTLELVREPSWEFDELFGRVSSAYGFLARRDAAYVRWRYLDAPDGRFVVVALRKWRQLVGWLVYRLDSSRLLLGDLLVHPEAVGSLDVALGHLVAVHRPATVEGWFPPRPRWLSDHLGRIGFLTTAEPQDLSLMCVPFELRDAAALMRESLYYTWGDSDLF